MVHTISAPDPDREAWLRQRRESIGSTDAAPALGIGRKTPLHVYLDKLGELPDRDNTRMAWGRRLEEVVAQAYAEETGRPVSVPTQRMARHPDHGWMTASIDRYVEIDGERSVLEIKTAGDDRAWGEAGTDQVPSEYLCQVQHQLAVTGLARAHIAVLFRGSDLQIYPVLRNERFIRHMLKIERDLWERIKRRDPPPLDWEHPSTPELLPHLYQLSRGKIIQLPEGLAQVAEWYCQARDEKRALEARLKELGALLLAGMEDAQTGYTPAGHKIQRLEIHRKGYTVEPSKHVELRVFSPKNKES